MASQSPDGERDAERRLNLSTLAIASTASACAALVTSQLWIAGTWIAAALTPVIVTLVSELLHRPTERLGRALTSDRTAPFPPAEPPVAATERAPGRRQAEPDPDAPPPRPRPDLGGGPSRELPSSGAPVRVYRSGATGSARGDRQRSRSGTVPSSRTRRRKVALGAVVGTAAAAFAIALAAITVPELIAGQSIVNGDKGSTFLGGKSRAQRDTDQGGGQQPTTTGEEQTETPAQTTPSEDEQPTRTTPPATETTPPASTTPAPRAAPPATTTPSEPAP